MYLLFLVLFFLNFCRDVVYQQISIYTFLLQHLQKNPGFCEPESPGFDVTGHIPHPTRSRRHATDLITAPACLVVCFRRSLESPPWECLRRMNQLGGGFKYFFWFSPRSLGKWLSNLTNIFRLVGVCSWMPHGSAVVAIRCPFLNTAGKGNFFLKLGCWQWGLFGVGTLNIFQEYSIRMAPPAERVQAEWCWLHCVRHETIGMANVLNSFIGQAQQGELKCVGTKLYIYV